MTDFDMNRRRVLAAIGGTGVAAFAGLGLATDDAVRYTMASSHSCDDYTLDAEWRETYTRDGETTLLEYSESPDGTESGDPPVIHLSNIMPGDWGTVGFELTADRTNNNADTEVTPTLGLDLTGTAENGINDPEGEAGDTTEDTGELQEYLQIKIYNDGGILGVDSLGADNLDQDITEDTIEQGMITDVADDLNERGLGTIDTSDNTSSVSVTLRWEFPDDSNINVTQTDSVTFTLDIGCN
jgi:hypothetical protein